MLGPKKEDIQKIHAEVNQIVNQRLSLATLAVTVFGALVAWLIPKSTPSAGSEVGAFIYGATILLLLVLFSLFLLAHHLTYMLRIYTTYLDESNASNWEKDWSAYRARFKYVGYTKPQALIFLILGILSAIFPFLLALVYSLNFEPKIGAIVCVLAGGLYAIFVSGMGFWKWFAKEDEMRQRWKKLKGKQR
ncbi:MAG: hypothetical protein HY863_06525 [Chloroflexi bacterium]|nr:hypothetical protein [Chloroflexota bacterium]